MHARDRLKIEMGSVARDFMRQHPIDAPEFTLIVGELDGFLAASLALATEQRDGVIQRHAASLRKKELDEQIRTVHLPHLARAGRNAAQGDPELASLFDDVKPRKDTFAALRAAAGGMAAAAEQRKQSLQKGGMSMMVLGDLEHALGAFDAAVEQGNTGRARHIAATAKLRVVATEIVRRVEVLDAVNRLRFRDQPDLLAAWLRVSKVRAMPKSDAEPAGDGDSQGTTPAAPGDVRPAA